jgi:hypothetical protein
VAADSDHRASHRRRQCYTPPDLSFFARLTHRSAYWLGFLMADGCVSRREVIVVLQQRDAIHLLSLLEVLGCPDRPLRPANAGRGVRLAIGSAALARQLLALGIVPGRAGSSTPVAPELARSRDFWRGLVDGDGSLRFDRKTGIPSLVVVGAPGLIQQFADFLAPLFTDGFRPRPYAHSQSDAVLMLSVGGHRAKLAVTRLYGGDPPDALPRKRALAERVMGWERSVVSRYPWHRWGDGSRWTLRKGEDYWDPRRLWEAGRRAARRQQCRLAFEDLGDLAVVQFVSR